MKKTLYLLSLLLLSGACGTPTTENANRQTNQANLILANSNTTQISNATNTAEKEGHEHAAPHGGTLVEFGDEFAHLEIVLDATTGILTAYALDAEAEKSVPIAQEELIIEIESPAKMTVNLVAVENALTGEKRGATSEFRGQSEQLKNLSEFEARVKSITIRGRQFKDVEFNFPKGNEHGH